ncbi:hypothetical protein SAMN05216419_10715 [Nitrosomonas cryotolerans]|uniref:Uncharacterized protein n=1 Tax=Nitrosomonas cryotolerans ATCC 49181 TaxID=1131553 RepID=A0A1N6FYS5_9PROT|nr:hypothetical protein SAMN05216419_10715 [Nitrosomonas cryotolerans]SIO00351.1 hypothetical protein SAMN02743940_0466 [Nitrosomonas cryotolerans ATCC 49181]
MFNLLNVFTNGIMEFYSEVELQTVSSPLVRIDKNRPKGHILTDGEKEYFHVAIRHS